MATFNAAGQEVEYDNETGQWLPVDGSKPVSAENPERVEVDDDPEDDE